jgi:hypothetical protein
MLALLSSGAASAQAPATPPTPPPAAAPAAPAPRQDLTLILNGAQRPLLKLAFPALSGIATLSAPAASAAREIEQTLRDDLEASRLFAIQGPAELGVLTLTGDAAKDAEQYLSLGNEVLLAGEVKKRTARWRWKAASSTSRADSRSSASGIAAMPRWPVASPTPSPTKSSSTSPASAGSLSPASLSTPTATAPRRST